MKKYTTKMLMNLGIVSLLSIPALVYGQEKCASDFEHEKMFLENTNYKKHFNENQSIIKNLVNNSKVNDNTTLKVPVVIHILNLGEEEGVGTNISDAQIHSAIQSLNDAYRGLAPYTSSGVDMNIEFSLAAQDSNGNSTTGINRIDASGVSDYATEGMTSANRNEIKALSDWSNTEYYNVWVVSEINGNDGGSGTQGYAYFPGASQGVDGTVILHNSIGYDPEGEKCFNLKSYTNRNVTFIHELGHALGLYHTFQGDESGTVCPENTNCETEGDLVCDTPPHNRSSNCDTSLTNLCGESVTGHINNFMDYSSDVCQTEFTEGQKTRARAALTGTRSSLLTSQGAVPVVVPESKFITYCAEEIKSCVGENVKYIDVSTGNATQWNWTFEGGTPASSTDKNPTVTYASPGNYNVSLVAQNSVGQGDSYSKINYIYESLGTHCQNTVSNTGNYGYGFKNVTFNEINNTSSYSVNGYIDNFCKISTKVNAGESYSLSISDRTTGSANSGYVVYIDYNNNGDFSDAGEKVMEGTVLGGTGKTVITGNIEIPETALKEQMLRMRVMQDQYGVSNSCETLFTGKSEDYGVYINSSLKTESYNYLEKLSIYPNPSTGIINVDLLGLKNATIQVYNLTGQLVHQAKGVNQDTYQFNLKSNRGIYFIKVSSEGQNYSYRMIKK